MGNLKNTTKTVKENVVRKIIELVAMEYACFEAKSAFLHCLFVHLHHNFILTASKQEQNLACSTIQNASAG